MHLKSLEINGFKSFAKKSKLDFAHSVTSIVGPNGSGKSNVAESFRFVLGEQSIKSMRGKRGEDLIWNGSGDLPKGNRASVKIVFDNTKKVFPVDFEEVAIERVVNRDGTNEYFINGSLVRLKDVIELLGSAHIGSSGHHIISQGEADRILSANIKERKEMIEDALGLKVYQYKKQESLRKLDKTAENIDKVESLRREIAPHLRFLKKQVEKVEKARELRDLLRVQYREYFAREKVYLDTNKNRIEGDLTAPVAEYEALGAELERVKKIVAESNKQDEKGAVLLSIDSKLREERRQKENVLSESGKIDGEIMSMERFIKREEEKARSASDKTVYWRDVESFVKVLENDLSGADSSDDIGKLKEIISKIKDSCKTFLNSNKTEVQNNGIDEAKNEINSLKEKKGKIQSEVSEINRRIEALEVEYRNIQQEIEKEKDTNRDAEREVFRIIAKQNEVRSKIDLLKMERERVNREEVQFNQELQDAYLIVGREATAYEEVTGAESVLTEQRIKQDERRKEIEKTKIRLEENGGAGGAEIEKEYKETMERDEFLARELVDLEKSSESLRQIIADLDIKLKQEFEEGVNKINAEFGKLFSLMFGGGTASINVVREKKRRRSDSSLEISEDGVADEESEENVEYDEGIDINVSLPRKKIKGLIMLSGGERALTSIALLFAISQVKPPPFIILDETDAALDEANSRKYGDMIESLAKYSQLVLITHNRETMSRAGILYGVTMGKDGASKLLSIQFEEAVAVAK